MEKALISVIIPVFNRAQTITRTIDNMLNQTYDNIEIIVVDDGSKDNIEEVMQKYKENKKIFFYRNKENHGACFARNFGVEKSLGEFIAFQDSDDIWKENKLEKQLKYLREKEADICICGMVTHYDSGKDVIFHKKIFSEKNITLENELGKSFISTQLLFGKKECFINEKFDEKFPRFQDWDIGIRLVKNYKMVYLNEILVEREMQSNSISKNTKNGYIGITLLLDKYKDELENYPKAEASILEFYAQFQEYEKISCKDTLKKSLKQDFKVKTLIKYIGKCLGFYKLHLIIKQKKKNIIKGK